MGFNSGFKGLMYVLHYPNKLRDILKALLETITFFTNIFQYFPVLRGE